MRKLKDMIVTLLRRKMDDIELEESTNTKVSPVSLWGSCEDLPIKIFYEILKTENLNLLIRKGNASQDQLKNKWADILDEYWNMTNAGLYQSNLRRAKSLIQKQNKYTSLMAILTLAELGINVKDKLKYWGLETVKEALRQVRVLKTKIAMKMAELQGEETKKIVYNFYKDLAILEQLLNRSLNVETLTVSYWVELHKLAKQINKTKK